MPPEPRSRFAFETVGNRLVFFHCAESTGCEPWVSDGTEAGTQLLADLQPGSASSEPRNLAVAGGLSFFTADDGVHGRELWRSDGTAVGTVLVKDVIPGSLGLDSSYDNHVLGHALFFVGGPGGELWRSDGTAGGTQVVKRLSDGVESAHIYEMAHVGDTLFVAGLITDGVALWKTQGTAETTVRVLEMAKCRGLAEVAGALLFVAPGPTGDMGLWRSDGTAEGTQLLEEFPGPNSLRNRPNDYTVIGGLLVFSADDGAHGRELWRSDGTPEGTYMLEEVRPGKEGSFPSTFTLAGDTVYYSANDGESGYELWATPLAKLHDPLAIVPCVVEERPLGGCSVAPAEGLLALLALVGVLERRRRRR